MDIEILNKILNIINYIKLLDKTEVYKIFE